MKEIFINEDNLPDKEIDEEVTRVKALMVNDKNEILLVYCYDEYQFPGGHLEVDETNEEGLIREIKEETGVITKIEDYSYFMTIKDYIKNYRETNLNRCNKIVYYVLNKSYDIDLENTNFSYYEKKGDFKLELIPLDNIEETLIKNNEHHAFARIIVNEMLQVLKEYKKMYKRTD